MLKFLIGITFVALGMLYLKLGYLINVTVSGLTFLAFVFSFVYYIDKMTKRKKLNDNEILGALITLFMGSVFTIVFFTLVFNL